MGLDLSHHPLEKWGDLEKGQVPGSQRGEPPQKVERKGASERQEGRGGGAQGTQGEGPLESRGQAQRGKEVSRWESRGEGASMARSCQLPRESCLNL